MIEQIIADVAARLHASFELIRFGFEAIVNMKDKDDSKEIDNDILRLLSMSHYLTMGQSISNSSDALNATTELDESSIAKLDPIFSITSSRMSNAPFTRLKLAAISKACGEILDFRVRHSKVYDTDILTTVYAADILNFYCESEIDYYKAAKNR